MKSVYKFFRVIVLLWAGALVYFQSGYIKDLRQDREFWIDTAQETAVQALELHRMDQRCPVRREQ